MTPTTSPNGKALQMWLHLTMLAIDYAEWLALSEALPKGKRVKFRSYAEKMRYLVRDVRTSFERREHGDMVMDELTSDRAKTLAEWFQMGIECGNLEEIMQVLNDAKRQEAIEDIFSQSNNESHDSSEEVQ